jgi:hypothetical protein
LTYGRVLQRRLARATRAAGELEQHDLAAELRHGLRDPAAPGLAPQARLLAIRLRHRLAMMDLADGLSLDEAVERLEAEGIRLLPTELAALEAGYAVMANPAGQEYPSNG